MAEAKQDDAPKAKADAKAKAEFIDLISDDDANAQGTQSTHKADAEKEE